MANPGSKGAVAAAIAGNATVMMAKFVAFLFTGSGALLSEAIHTLADLLNQILLMVGIVQSSRQPDDSYEYGYQADIRFEGDVLAEKLRPQLQSAYDNIRTYDEFEKFVLELGDDVVELLTEKIDTIERRIRRQVPQAKHMDLEAE